MTDKQVLELTPSPNSDPVPIVTESAQVLEIINRVAMDPNADIDKMERLLAMYQEIQKGKAEREFNGALQSVQAEMPSIRRDAENKQTHSTYAKIETINAALIPVYTRHGFSLSFGTEQAEQPEHIKIVCNVSHVSGHTRKYEYDSPITTVGIQGNAMMTRTHASGSALSYGRRYLTLMIFNATLTDEDDDGNQATPKEEPPKIGPKRLRKIIDGMLDCLSRQDGPGLSEIADELEADEKDVVWRQLRSWERSAIKALLNQQASVTDPNYVEPLPREGALDLASWALTALMACKDADGLKTVWKAVGTSFKQNGRDVPLEVEAKWTEMREALAEKT
jgi:hypothetical protein